MTAATPRRSPHRANHCSTSPTPAPTETIAPPPDTDTNNRLRNATTAAASCNDNAPATHAAAISPCECPITASTTTPAERHNRANDTITAHNTGCTTSTRSNPGAPDCPRTTSINDQSTHPPNASPHKSICSAKTADSPYNRRPIPTHCEPCPGNTNTTEPPNGSARPLSSSGPVAPVASDREADDQLIAISADEHGAVWEYRPSGQ